MKVIFVDVDGVLNSDDFIDSVKGKQDIDIKTVLLLKRAIEETGAKIVMDTSFRYTQSFLKVQEMLLQNGIMFDKIKELAGEMGYAKEVKEFKANPNAYKAHVGDVSTVIRVALTKRTNTPDMYELNNKVRLIDVSGFPIKNADEFVGFICGILSQDHDLEQVYLDSFLKVAKLEEKDITGTLGQLDEIGKQFNVTFVISVSLDKEEVPEAFHDKIAVAL